MAPTARAPLASDCIGDPLAGLRWDRHTRRRERLVFLGVREVAAVLLAGGGVEVLRYPGVVLVGPGEAGLVLPSRVRVAVGLAAAPGPALPARISKRPSKATNGIHHEHRGSSKLVMFALFVSSALWRCIRVR